MNDDTPAYGLWPLVIVNAAVFIIFAFSFSKPRTRCDWRSFGAFSAFLVALFTEMYGFPLTIYLFSGWLASRYPGFDLLAHNSGHLWQTLLGWEGDPHVSPLHLLSDGVILGGFILLAAAWKVLYAAQRAGTVAASDPYAHVRHPQYIGFVLIMVGFLIQWPTLITLAMLLEAAGCTLGYAAIDGLIAGVIVLGEDRHGVTNPTVVNSRGRKQ